EYRLAAGGHRRGSEPRRVSHVAARGARGRVSAEASDSGVSARRSRAWSAEDTAHTARATADGRHRRTRVRRHPARRRAAARYGKTSAPRTPRIRLSVRGDEWLSRLFDLSMKQLAQARDAFFDALRLHRDEGEAAVIRLRIVRVERCAWH